MLKEGIPLDSWGREGREGRSFSLIRGEKGLSFREEKKVPKKLCPTWLTL